MPDSNERPTTKVLNLVCSTTYEYRGYSRKNWQGKARPTCTQGKCKERESQRDHLQDNFFTKQIRALLNLVGTKFSSAASQSHIFIMHGHANGPRARARGACDAVERGGGGVQLGLSYQDTI